MSETYHTIPNYPAAENRLASMLAHHPDYLDEFPDLCEDHFFSITPREIFRRVKEGVNYEFIMSHLSQEVGLEKFGGIGAIVEVLAAHPGATIEAARHHYIELNLYLARRMAIQAGEALKATAISEHSADALGEAIGAKITALAERLHGRSENRSIKDVINECLDMFRDKIENKIPGGIQTSVAKLNYLFRGLFPGHTIVLSGYPGSGKSMLSMQLAIDAARQGHQTMIFSLEMTDVGLVERALSYIGKIPLEAITDPLPETTTKGFLSSMQRAGVTLAQTPIEIVKAAGWHAGKIEAAVRAAHRKKPVRVVVVDFIQQLRAHPDQRRESKEQQLSGAANDLASLSKELGFTLIIPSQLNKDGAAKHAEAINEAADLHLKIRQIKNDDDCIPAGIYCAKSRWTPHEGKTLMLKLDGAFCRFVEMSEEEIKAIEKNEFFSLPPQKSASCSPRCQSQR